MKSSSRIVADSESAKALQQLAREQMKQKLLKDICMDIQICNLEGWDYREYLKELHQMIAHFDSCEVTNE